MTLALQPEKVADEPHEFRGGELVVEEGKVGDVSEQRLGLLRLAQHVVAADANFAAGRAEQTRRAS